MLGFLLRLLPFWVREPLLIVVGSVFGVRIMYLAVRDQELVPAGIGAVFLVFTALRVHEVVRALRARRSPGPAASTAGVAVAADAPAQTAVGPRPGPATPRKDHNAWGQAVAAIALFGALGAALWLGPRVMPSDVSTPQAVSCHGAEHEELPKVYKKAPRPVTGEELCEALNRPYLPKVLGTPTETATTVSGTNNTAP